MMDHETPLGVLRLYAGPQGLRAIAWPDSSLPVSPDAEPTDTGTLIVLDLCRCCLDAYFAGLWDHYRQLRERIPLDLSGTLFQRRVWAVLYSLPRMSVTYSDVASFIGNPKAVRAVGNACGSNPIPILIPCHRVLSSEGLGGYSGGIERKRWLLDHEQKAMPRAPTSIPGPAALRYPALIPVERPDLFQAHA